MERQAAAQEIEENATSSDEEFIDKAKRTIGGSKDHHSDEDLKRIFETHGVKEDQGLIDALSKWKNSK